MGAFEPATFMSKRHDPVRVAIAGQSDTSFGTGEERDFIELEFLATLDYDGDVHAHKGLENFSCYGKLCPVLPYEQGHHLLWLITRVFRRSII